MMRRIIQNQHTVIEQNSKIIQSQELQEALDKDEAKITNLQVPHLVKVSKGRIFKTREWKKCF